MAEMILRAKYDELARQNASLSARLAEVEALLAAAERTAQDMIASGAIDGSETASWGRTLQRRIMNTKMLGACDCGMPAGGHLFGCPAVKPY